MCESEIFKDQKIIESCGKSLNECRKLNKFTDLTLKSSDNQEIRIHKSVLWSASLYFQTMFDTKLKEGSETCIELTNIEMIDLEIIIEYLYTGEAKIPRKRSNIIFEKANFFQLIDLQEFCSNLLLDEINDENCLEFLRYSDLFCDKNLKCGSIEYIAKNADKLLEKYIQEFSNDEFESIISNQQLQMSSEKIFTSITKWLKFDLPNRNSYIEKLLENVNLLELPEDFMDMEMQSNETLNKNNTFSLTLLKMITKSFRNLKSKTKENITVVVNRESPSIAFSDALEIIREVVDTNQLNTRQNSESQEQKQPKKSTRSLKPTKESRILRRFSPTSSESSSTTKNNNSSECVLQSKDFQIKDQRCIFVTYHYGIEKLNLHEKKWYQKYLYHTDRLNYAISSHQDNIYFTGGLSPKLTPSSVVRCYNEQQNKIIRIPSMLEGREFHKSICVNDQIFVCGGETNSGSVEYYDIGREIWVKGPQMNNSRYCFGLSSNDGIIYAVGGSNENSIERFDTRQGQWEIITNMPKNKLLCKSLCINNLLYCVEPSSSGYIYDLRTLKLQDEVCHDSDIRYNQINWNKYDVVELDGKVYGIFQNQFYQYNEFKWHNLRPSYLKQSIQSINLCTLDCK